MFIVKTGESKYLPHLEKCSINNTKLHIKRDWIWTWGLHPCVNLQKSFINTAWQRHPCVRCCQHPARLIGQEQRWRVTFVFLRVHFSECHTSLSVSLNLFVFHTRANYTQPLKSNQKNPQGLCSRTGACPISFSLGWLPAETNKGLCYAALLQISVVKHNGKEQQNVKCMHALSIT